MNDRAAISETHFQGLPGLSRAARDKLLQLQPTTVLEALKIRGVGRKTTEKLLALGLFSDPEGLQTRTRTAEEMGIEI
jgi:tRNA U34 5-carboxymethylaminomethyl modifying enzyme MnmG/GidA